MPHKVSIDTYINDAKYVKRCTLVRHKPRADNSRNLPFIAESSNSNDSMKYRYPGPKIDLISLLYLKSTQSFNTSLAYY